MANEIDPELLIALIEPRPVLWDKTSSLYKDRNETKQAWKEVCIELNSDFQNYNDEEKNKYGKEVVKRWVNIRDAFNKFLKKEKSLQKSGSGASKLKKYVYAEQLKFLTKIFTSRSTEDSLSANCETEKSSELDVLETDNRNNDSQFEIPPRNKPLGSRKRKVDEVDMRILKALEQPEDRHISFFKGIIPSLNTFTEDETLQFQMDVLQVINNIKKRRFQSHQQHPSFNSPSLATTSTATNNYYCYNPPYNTTTEHGRSFREPTVTPPDFSSVNRNIPTHTQTTANYPQQATTRGYFHQYNPIDDNPSSVESNSTQESVYSDLDFT